MTVFSGLSAFSNTGEPALFPEDEPRDESGKPVMRP